MEKRGAECRICADELKNSHQCRNALIFQRVRFYNENLSQGEKIKETSYL